MSPGIVGIFYSALPQERARAEWIASRLAPQELEAAMVQHSGQDHSSLVEELRELVGRSACVLVLLSAGTTGSAGLAYVELRMEQLSVVPVKVEACDQPGLLAGIVMGRLYGEDEAADLAQLKAILRAGFGMPARGNGEARFPGPRD